jgi:hypothetical protein
MLTFENAFETGITGRLIGCSCGCEHMYLCTNVATEETFLRHGDCGCPEYRLHTVSVYPHLTQNRWRNEVEYYAYIRSKDWAVKAKQRREELGNRCTLCATTVNLQVHHNTYFNLGHELPIDLTVLCGKHHEFFERGGGIPKYTGFRKGRIFLDDYCIEETTKEALDFMNWFLPLSYSSFGELYPDDIEEQTFEWCNFIMNLTPEQVAFFRDLRQ